MCIPVKRTDAMAGVFQEAANLQGARGAPRVNNSRQTGQHNAFFKATQLCKFFVSGKCTRGTDCNFAHGQESLKQQPDLYKTQLCKSFDKSGECMMGDECMYAHGRGELRRSWANSKPQHPGSARNRKNRTISSFKNIPEEAPNVAAAMPGCILLPDMRGLLACSVLLPCVPASDIYSSDGHHGKEIDASRGLCGLDGDDGLSLAWNPCGFNSDRPPFSPSSACKENYNYGPPFSHVSTDCTTGFTDESDTDDSCPAFSRVNSMNEKLSKPFCASQQLQVCDGQFLLDPCLALDEDIGDAVLVVKNTFLHFDQESPKSARKRSQSTPPGASEQPLTL